MGILTLECQLIAATTLLHWLHHPPSGREQQRKLQITETRGNIRNYNRDHYQDHWRILPRSLENTTKITGEYYQDHWTILPRSLENVETSNTTEITGDHRDRWRPQRPVKAVGTTRDHWRMAETTGDWRHQWELLGPRYSCRSWRNYCGDQCCFS